MSHHHRHANRHNHNSYLRPRFAQVAPPDTLRRDFQELDARTVLRCAYDVEELLLMQSVQGHAHAGHGLFYGKTYPNTTMDDICRSLRLNPNAVKAARQDLIDEVLDFVDRVIDGEKPSVACSTSGEPLLRCGALRQFDIDAHGVLQGLYIGGLRDDAEIRELANERYGVEMGYGKCFIVNQEVLNALGLNGFSLAREAHEYDIPRFEDAGMFAESENEHTAYMYVRFKVGPGASDDAAIIMAGKMLGFSAAVGCFLADAVDTLEKYVPEYSDQDSDISEYIKQHYPQLGLTRDYAVDLAYLCAIPPEKQGCLPDNSLRHILQVDRKTDQCALESHFTYLLGKPYSPMVLDHGESTNEELYRYIDERWSGFKAVH